MPPMGIGHKPMPDIVNRYLDSKMIQFLMLFWYRLCWNSTIPTSMPIDHQAEEKIRYTNIKLCKN